MEHLLVVAIAALFILPADAGAQHRTWSNVGSPGASFYIADDYNSTRILH